MTVTGPSQTPGSYDLEVTFDFDVEFLGHQRGVQTAEIPQELFTKAFLDNLRSAGRYEAPGLLATYEGREDVTTESGERYHSCDKVVLTHLRKPVRLKSALERWDGRPSSGEPLDLTVYLSPDVPVLGVVSADVKTSIGASTVIAGGDYSK